jgi:hypothetical protein
MRRRSLRIWTWLIVATAVAVAVGEKIAERVYGMDWLDAEVVAALLAALAGALAIVFQRRNEFIDSLRAVWADCLAAIGHLRTLYMREACSEQQILEAYRSLSVAIDSMRAVYRNVGETDRHIGFYPFETLHDLRRMLEADFMSGTTPDAAQSPGRDQRHVAAVSDRFPA